MVALRLSVEFRGVTHTYHSSRAVITFGRSRTCTIFIDDPALSRTHAQIESENEGRFVRDLNSRNGTHVNGETVTRHLLKDGDHIEIGNTSIVFSTAEPLLATDDGGVTASWTAQLFSKGARRRKLRGADLETNKELRRLQHLLAINKKIAAELEPERVLMLILDSAVDLVEAERGFLVLESDSGLIVPVARDFWRKDIPTPEFELSRSIALEVIRRGEPLIADDAAADERFDEHASVHGLKIRSVLCVPLKARGRIIGALYLDNRFTRGSFSESDAAILEAFADQAAISLWHSDRFQKTQTEAERRRREAELSAEALQRVQAQLVQLEKTRGWKHDWSTIIGRSPAMQRCLSLVDRVTDTDLAVLILGESGSGKEVLARRIHANGRRAAGPFVLVECGSLGPERLELELFGSESTTPPVSGFLEQADRGTLFLDSVDDLPAEAQKRLLRFLESGELRRLGDGSTRCVDVRVLAATSADLENLIAQNRFRQDLYFRLKGVQIEVPPLRERIDDIPLLLQHALSETERRPEIAPKALKVLCAYSWPGNVRELKNEVHRLAVLVDDVLAVRDLPPHIALDQGSSDHLPGGLKGYVERIERDLLVRVLESHRGNKTRVALALGLSRLGLRKKMARYGLADDNDEAH